MRIISSVREMQQEADNWRREGKKIALVPTMGYLHEGHLALMRKVRSMADVVAASIFVNPTQFGPSEDFERYPRDMERDARLSEEAGVDVIFAPEAREMYPEGYQTYLEVTGVTVPLCGKSRPGHFRGVTTVVAKLFNIAKPHLAIFGEKDYQQLAAIRTMVRDMNMDLEILGHPIVREAGNLAMSSRNVYLDPVQRTKALRLNRALAEAQALVDGGERSSSKILGKVRETIDPGDDVRIDYIELCHPATLEEVDRVDGAALLALAVHVGKTRLIDNRVLRSQN
jgi:pantoate--beta-alanine ligase